MTGWYPADYSTQPFYPRVFRVIDLASTHLPGPRLTYWIKARQAAFAEWQLGDIKFGIVQGGGYRPSFVTLDVTQTQDGTAGQADFGRLPPDSTVSAPGVAWAHIDTEWFEQCFLSNFKRDLIDVICHEVGHTLGFGHGGTGIMTTDHSGSVSVEEINALKAYWKT